MPSAAFVLVTVSFLLSFWNKRPASVRSKAGSTAIDDDEEVAPFDVSWSSDVGFAGVAPASDELAACKKAAALLYITSKEMR